MTRPGASLINLFVQAVEHAVRTLQVGVQAGIDAGDRVLDAALIVLARCGTRHATMDDVAAESGVSRATLFRRFGGKDQLFERAIAREIRNFIADVGQHVAGLDDPVERLVVAFGAALRLRHHVLFAAAPERPAELLTAFGQGDPSPLDLAHGFIARQLADGQARGLLTPGDPDLRADVLLRVLIGYLTGPEPAFDLDDPDTARRITRTAIGPITDHHGTDGHRTGPAPDHPASA